MAIVGYSRGGLNTTSFCTRTWYKTIAPRCTLHPIELPVHIPTSPISPSPSFKSPVVQYCIPIRSYRALQVDLTGFPDNLHARASAVKSNARFTLWVCRKRTLRPYVINSSMCSQAACKLRPSHSITVILFYHLTEED